MHVVFESEIEGDEEVIPGLEEVTDGRRKRKIRLRAKLIETTQQLMRGGNLIPTVNQIALVASCSARSVFQHFKELQDLYEEALRKDPELRRRISVRAFSQMHVLPPEAPKEGEELSEDRKALLKIFAELPLLLVQQPRKSQKRRQTRAPTP